ncbi:MAG: protein BatD [Chitinophagaceae bacterium]|nr:protein BatD [Chitinophagaceae bacterium]
MRTILFSILLFFCLLPALDAQVVFKTIVQPTVETGRSFPVEYVIESTADNDAFYNPLFEGLRLINGPSIYHGKTPNGAIPVKNYVFTLIAEKPGRYRIPGAIAKMNGKFIQSDDQFIDVFDSNREVENNSEYFLHPGEDPYEKIRRNLFVKVMVTKKNCYIGEPVVATFKLYSRLQSKSDIVKNPGFYGFSVQDIVNIDDKVSNTESIGGKAFIVHTIRTVQLYPLQSGMFTIDAMEVLNKVEFSRSGVNKRTEQEIVEGVFENREEKNGDNTTVTYESSISTDRVAITVKPYPEKNKPPLFSGATGTFNISAYLKKNELARNEEGELVIVISGKGNFIQLTGPVIQWPVGVEGFEAVITDTLDKTHVPLMGEKAFRFPFVAPRSGSYTIPPVSFTFFDTDSNKYRTVSTKPVEIKINEKEKETVTIAQAEDDKKNKQGILWWAAGGLILSVLTILWRVKKRTTMSVKRPVEEKGSTIDDALQPAYIALKENGSRFYIIVQKIIWDQLSSTLHLSGTRINKEEILRSKQISPDRAQEIIAILEQCEAAAFTMAEFIHDKQELLVGVKKVLEQIKAGQ